MSDLVKQLRLLLADDTAEGELAGKAADEIEHLRLSFEHAVQELGVAIAERDEARKQLVKGVTDAMVDRALNAWFASPPSETDRGLEHSMRAALEAALTDDYESSSPSALPGKTGEGGGSSSGGHERGKAAAITSAISKEETK